MMRRRNPPTTGTPLKPAHRFYDDEVNDKINDDHNQDKIICTDDDKVP